MLPPGLNDSTLAQIVEERCSTDRFRRTNGVLPTVSRMLVAALFNGLVKSLGCHGGGLCTIVYRINLVQLNVKRRTSLTPGVFGPPILENEPLTEMVHRHLDRFSMV